MGDEGYMKNYGFLLKVWKKKGSLPKSVGRKK
jgi:hypothetical protein